MKFVYLILIACASLANQSVQADDARQIADLNPGSTGSFPSNLVVFGESLYFSAYTLETGREFWKTDGTAIDLIADINPTADDIGFGVMEGNDSDPNGFTGSEGILYFSAFDPMRGGELWRYDETNASRVADISPDQNDTVKIVPNSSWPHEFVTLNDTLYFSANSGTTVQNYELWKYDGVSAQLVANLHPELGPDHSSFPNGLVSFEGAIYFMADDGTNGFELWRHDGTQTAMFDLNPGGLESSSYPKNFTPFNGHLYFQAIHADSGFELWKTDGTSASLVSDLYPGPSSSSPGECTVFDGELFFQADDGVSGAELWKFDGAETTLVTDLNPAGDAFPSHLTLFQNTLLFSATDGSHGWELWKFDGNSVSLVVDLNTTGDSFPGNLTVFDDVLYFVATTPSAGYEIWKYDGVNVTLAADINPGEGSSFPQFLTPFDGELFFRAADDGVSNWELWALSTPTSVDPPSVNSITNTGTTITLNVTGTPGAPLVLEATADFQSWQSVQTNTPAGDTADFTITPTEPYQFYRISVQ